MSTLSCDNIVKDYPGTRALDHVSASFDSGKINALLGKNGSGKSTLCKIFAGAESATSGEFYLDGQKLSFRNPTDAAKSGIVLVYQETSLVPTLTVMENIFMGRLPKKPGGLINWKLVQSETERLLKVMDVRINPKSKIMHLPMWQRQVVEICKALSQDPKVLILDEPTSALAKAEVEKLFAAIRKVKENDVIIIYISHKLAEIHEIADTVTVLRDAQYVGKKNIEEIDNAGMIAMMFGKTEIRKRPADVVPTDEPVMEVKHLTRAGWYEDISFTLYKGEVLGIAGLDGSGRTEVLENLFGAMTREGGTITLHGKEIQNRTPKESIKNGFALLTEERRATGIFGIRDIRENTVISSLKDYLMGGICLSDKQMKEKTEWAIQAMHIKTPTQKTQIRSLSGGNQQKVIIGRWLLTKPEVLLLDEPTRGIDVGAKYEIYQLIIDLANEGKGVIMVSSEMPELLGVCDRIIVMSGGQVAGEVDAKNTSQEEILTLAAKYV